MNAIHTYFLCVKVRVLVFVSNYMCFRTFLGALQPLDSLVLISFCFCRVRCSEAEHPPTLNLVLPQPPTGDRAFFSWCPAFIAICFSNSAILSFFSFHGVWKENFMIAILQFASSNLTAPCNLTASCCFAFRVFSRTSMRERGSCRVWGLFQTVSVNGVRIQNVNHPRLTKNCVEDVRSIPPCLHVFASLCPGKTLHVKLVGVTHHVWYDLAA